MEGSGHEVMARGASWPSVILEAGYIESWQNLVNNRVL